MESDPMKINVLLPKMLTVELSPLGEDAVREQAN